MPYVDCDQVAATRSGWSAPPHGSSGWAAYDITMAANGGSIAGDPQFDGASVWATGA
jgi:hypothetical protein